MKKELLKYKIPHHVAIIMDGNGRWARKLGKKRVYGHQNGTRSVNDCIEGCIELGVKNITLFVFSTENWKRPKFEINSLMNLLVSSLEKEKPSLMENRIKFLGKYELFKNPLIGWVLRKLGGYPVVRNKQVNSVDSVVKIFNDNENFFLTLAPEGTRAKVNSLKTGFYYIALKKK